MEIKAVKFRKDGFYTQPFVFGGEEGMDKFDHNIRYRGSLQNYLIDTGNEVILVDTGIPAGTPEEAPDENSKIFCQITNPQLRRRLGLRIFFVPLRQIHYKPWNISE